MSIFASRLMTCSLAAMFLSLASGCGHEPGPERRVVSGSVSYVGTPIASGEIRFVPLTEGPVAAGFISNGKYEITHRGGVVLGENQVQIIATGSNEPMTQEQLDMMGSVPRPMAIPARYNANSELRAKVETGRGHQTIDFDLQR